MGGCAFGCACDEYHHWCLFLFSIKVLPKAISEGSPVAVDGNQKARECSVPQAAGSGGMMLRSTVSISLLQRGLTLNIKH